MHGQISGEGGEELASATRTQDSSAGCCCGAKCQHEGGERGGCGWAAALGGQRNLYKGGTPKAILQMPALSLGMVLPLVARVTPCSCAGLGPWWDSC